MSNSTAGKDGGTNPRGIPYAPFVDKVEDFVSSRAEVDQVMKNFQELLSKYQFMQQNQEKRKTSLEEKVPEIQRSLDTVRFLKTRKPDSRPIDTTFELNDTLYAKAHVPPTKEVYLWLGANVMLSYPVEEAEILLEGRLKGVEQSLVHVDEDLDFLREQVTTVEVAVARVYNWDVTTKRKEKAEQEGGDGQSRPNG